MSVENDATMMRWLLWCCSVVLFAAPHAVNARAGDFFKGDIDGDYEENRRNLMPDAEMGKFQQHSWQILPFDLSCIKDRKLRKHIRSILKDKPLTMELSFVASKEMPGSYRARAKTHDDKYLRASWTKVIPPNKRFDVLEASYDDAVRQYNAGKVLDLEVKLPPIRGKEIPTLIFSQVVAKPGDNPEAVLTRAPATIRIYPKGRPKYDYHEEAEYINGGTALTTMTMKGNGIVDPSWTKGRAFFRPGRYLGEV